MSLLEEPESRVEGQKSQYDRSLDVLAESNFEHDRPLEHPRTRRPELDQCPEKWAQGRVGNCVRAELREPQAGFVAREAGRERDRSEEHTSELQSPMYLV